LQFVAWHIHLAGFDRGEMLSTVRPAVGEAAEEGLADVTEVEEEREFGWVSSGVQGNTPVNQTSV
jgi:hypothetical protein